MPRGKLQEVELVDPATTTAPASGRRPLAVAVGVLVLVLLLGGVQAVLSARENAALTRLQGVPGVIRPVDGTLEVVSGLPVGDTVDRTGEGSGALATAEDGTLTYRWFVPSHPGWVRELLPATPTTADDLVVLAGSACEPHGGTGDTDRIVCLVTDRAQVVSAGGVLQWRPATTTEIVVLDPADGSTLAQWPLEHGTSAVPFPDDLVVVASATQDTLLVTGHDTLTGAERWTLRLPSTPGGGPVSVFPAGDLVAVATPTGALRLLSRDGAVVRDDLVLVFDGAAGVNLPVEDGALVLGARWAWSTTAEHPGDPRGGSRRAGPDDPGGGGRRPRGRPDDRGPDRAPWRSTTGASQACC